MEAETYGAYWDEFYRQNYLQNIGGKALWDVPVDQSAGLDLPLFSEFFNTNLPLLDIGCGTGEIAAYFTRKGHRVIGADVAKEAIDIARLNHADKGIDFRVLDITDPMGCTSIHNEFGPVNLYIRGVMHQIAPDHLDRYVDHISMFLDGQGYVYMIEVAAGIRDHFLHHAEGFHNLPKAVQQIFISNLPPRGVTVEDIKMHFSSDRFDLRFCTETNLATNLQTPAGIAIQIPAVHALIQTKNIS